MPRQDKQNRGSGRAHGTLNVGGDLHEAGVSEFAQAGPSGSPGDTQRPPLDSDTQAEAGAEAQTRAPSSGRGGRPAVIGTAQFSGLTDAGEARIPEAGAAVFQTFGGSSGRSFESDLLARTQLPPSFGDDDDIEATMMLPRDDPNGPGRTAGIPPTLAKSDEVRARRGNQRKGRTTWNLRINRKAVEGNISGVAFSPNDTKNDLAPGLVAAFVDDSTLPEYEIVSKLGEGGCGAVYAARQTSLNRQLAIKTLHSSDEFGEHAQLQFVSEAVVTANLVHPNIVPIHDLGRTPDGKLFYSMKQITGQPWNELIHESQDVEQKLDILLHVCDAMAYAHSKGVIHRDLKPENVVVGEYGEVIVIDWGCAITTDQFEKQDSVLLEFQGGSGTPTYMPPEQTSADVGLVSAASDVYLLGAILYEILEGGAPHWLSQAWNEPDENVQLQIVMSAARENIIEPPRQTGELIRIAMKAMETHPEDRYQSVEEFQSAIREYRVTGRAEELLTEAKESPTGNYEAHQEALALFKDAGDRWKNNHRATAGEQEARLEYAKVALLRRDLDLAGQIVEGQKGRDFDRVRKGIRQAKQTRALVKMSAVVLFFAALGLSAFSFEKSREAANNLAELQTTTGELDVVRARKREADVAVKKAEEDVLAAEVATSAANKLKLEAEKAKKDAETDAMKAQQLATAEKAKASEATALAKKKAEEASIAIAEADKAKKEADLLNREAAKAKQQVAVAQKAAMAATAESERIKIQTKKQVYAAAFGIQHKLVLAAEQLGEYGKAVEEIDRALEVIYAASEGKEVPSLSLTADHAETNWAALKEPFEAQKRRFQQLEKSSGNVAKPIGRKVKTAAIDSTNGRVAAYHYSQQSGGQVVVYGDSGEVVCEGTARSIKSLCFSDDGQLLAAAGGRVRTVWKNNDGQWKRLSVTKSDGVEGRIPSSDIKCLFVQPEATPDQQYVVYVGNDDRATTDFYAVRNDELELVARFNLAGESKGSFKAPDFAITPGGRFLLLPTRHQSFRSFEIKWSDGLPSIKSLGPNSQRLLASSGGITDASSPERVVVSPNGQFLVSVYDDGHRSGKLLVVTKRDEQVIAEDDATSFPYSSPDDGDESRQLVRTQLAVHDLSFSDNGNYLAAGLSNSYLRVWQRNEDDRFVDLDAETLYNGNYFAGHAVTIGNAATKIHAVGFDSNRAGRFFSVATDDVIRSWNAETYGEYIRSFDQLVELFEAPKKLSTSIDDYLISPTDRFDRDIRIDSRRPEAVPVALIQDDEETEGNNGEPRTFGPRTPQTISGIGRVHSARFNRNGTRVIVGSDDRAAHVYIISDKDPEREDRDSGRTSLFFDPQRNVYLEGHIPEMSAVQFLPPAGDYLLTQDYFGSISVWDSTKDADGISHEVSRLQSKYSLSEFATSNDGSLVLAGGAVLEDGKLSHYGAIWRREDIVSDPKPVEAVRLPGQHKDYAITAVAVSPNNELAITAGRRGKVVLWNVSDALQKAAGTAEADRPVAAVALAKGEGHGKDQVSGCGFINNEEFVTAGYDGAVYRWKRTDGELVATEIERNSKYRTPDFIVRLRVSPAGKKLLTSEVQTTKDKSQVLTVMVWDGDRMQPVFQKTIPESEKDRSFKHDINWSSDGSRIVVIFDGEIGIYDANTFRPISAYTDGELESTRAAFSPSGKDLPSQMASFDGRVARLWDLESRENVTEFRSHASVYEANFSEDGKFVITGSDAVRVFDSSGSNRHGQTIFRIGQVHKSPVKSVAFCPIGTTYCFASVDQRGQLNVWDWNPNVGSGGPPEKPIQHFPPPEAVENDLLADISGASRVVWERTGAALAAIQAGKLRLWRVAGDTFTEIPITPPTGWDARWNDVAFSTDGGRLVAGGVGYDLAEDELVSVAAVWEIPDAGAAKAGAILRGGHTVDDSTDDNQTGVLAVAVTASNRILTGGIDGTVRPWVVTGLNTETVQQGLQLPELTMLDGSRPHSAPAVSIDTASTGSVVTADASGRVVIWPQSTGR